MWFTIELLVHESCGQLFQVVLQPFTIGFYVIIMMTWSCSWSIIIVMILLWWFEYFTKGAQSLSHPSRWQSSLPSSSSLTIVIWVLHHHYGWSLTDDQFTIVIWVLESCGATFGVAAQYFTLFYNKLLCTHQDDLHHRSSSSSWFYYKNLCTYHDPDHVWLSWSPSPQQKNHHDGRPPNDTKNACLQSRQIQASSVEEWYPSLHGE